MFQIRMERAASAETLQKLPTLEPFYYLTNFELVLATIGERYADLLSAGEAHFIARFSNLPVGSRALLTRMVMRSGRLFRASKLRYAEIGDVGCAVAPLVEAGWVVAQPILSIGELQGILTKAELIRHLSLPARYCAWKKDALVTMLGNVFPEPRGVGDWCPTLDDPVYHVAAAALCERFRLMFFGNFRQDLSEFVLSDLGIFTYERVEPSLHSRPFGTRMHIETLEQLQRCRELLDGASPLPEVLTAMPEPVLDCEWLEERRQKLLFDIARAFDRVKETGSAIAIYSNCTHPGARMRACRLHEQAHDFGVARALCLAARQAPQGEAERQQAQRILVRLNRKLRIDSPAEDFAPSVPRFDLLLEKERGGVEYGVRDHLAQQVSDVKTVRYVENDLINALFGLLCWDAIFAPLPGAFFHDFHRGPVDLTSAQFYRRRQREFQACLAQLDTEEYRSTIRRNYRAKWGVQSPFIKWYSLDGTLLQWALDCFPSAHLRLWFEWIVRDVSVNRSGFPDLVQFWPRKKQYRLVEVKGPGDRLQDNQRRLLEYCASHAIPVSVCYVTWA